MAGNLHERAQTLKFHFYKLRERQVLDLVSHLIFLNNKSSTKCHSQLREKEDV